MKKKQKKYSTDLEFEALMERAKIQGALMKSMQDNISIQDVTF